MGLRDRGCTIKISVFSLPSVWLGCFVCVCLRGSQDDELHILIPHIRQRTHLSKEQTESA